MTSKQWQRISNEQRLSHRLKLQSHQIERALSRRAVDAAVVGGDVLQQAVRFDLSEQLELGKEMLAGLKHELLGLLGVSSVQFVRENGVVRLRIDRQEDVPVALLDLIGALDEVDAGTAVLGLDDGNNPLLHDFSLNSLSHILVQGDENAGKTSFLRTIAVSLAMLNKQSQLQLVAVAPHPEKQTQLGVLNYLPHMLEPVINRVADCEAAFAFLEEEMLYRLGQKTVTPTILILVDDIERLLDHPQIVRQLLNLLQNGPEVGIHLVIAHGAVADKPVPELLKANIPFNIVGSVGSSEYARLATGLVDSEAELLQGCGDFVTVIGDAKFYFQAAYIDDYELHLIIDRLHRSRPQPILARSIQIAGENDSEKPTAENAYSFAFNEERVVLSGGRRETAESNIQPHPAPVIQMHSDDAVMIGPRKEERRSVPFAIKPDKKPKKQTKPVKRFVKRAPQVQLRRAAGKVEEETEIPSGGQEPSSTYFDTFETNIASEEKYTNNGEPIPFDLGSPPD